MSSIVAVCEGDTRQAGVALVELCQSEPIDGVMRDARGSPARYANQACGHPTWSLSGGPSASPHIPPDLAWTIISMTRS